jgi:hypothetical protein
MPFRQLIHGRVDRADHQRLKAEAAARGISMSRCIGDVVREYFALRQEMLSVIRLPAEPGAGHPGLVHSLVSRMEERLGTRADARADELSEGQRRLEAMLDRLVMLYLLHTPEVAPQLHSGATASANRRYGGYCRAVDDLLAGRSRSPRSGDADPPLRPRQGA